MKKIISLLLALVMCLSLCACGKEDDYESAVALMEAGEYQQAIIAFEAIEEYRNIREKISFCENAMLEEKYNFALSLMESGEYQQAMAVFEELSDYSDSKTRIESCEVALEEQWLQERYNAAAQLEEDGNTAQAAIAFGKLGDYQDSKERSFALWNKVAQRETISASYHTMGLRTDGTVVAIGFNEDEQCNVSDWTDIVAISSGAHLAVGLKSDGTVVADGSNGFGQCKVSDWTDIVAVAAGVHHTVGLKSDGTVVAVGRNNDGECEVSGWTDIVAVAAGFWFTVGLKKDGTVVAVGVNTEGECDVSDWMDIVAVSAGFSHPVGLKSDGTVVAVGSNKYGQCKVSGWTNIVAVSAGGSHTIGLKKDGTVVAVGQNDEGECEVSGWKLFDNADNLKNERIQKMAEANQRRIAEQQQAEQQRIAKQMATLMYKTNGVGIAAPQVGLDMRLIVVDCEDEYYGEDPLVLVNPVIVERRGELIESPEGCLSLPGITVSVQRSPYVRVRYYDLDGELWELEGEEGFNHLEEYSDGATERGKNMRQAICEKFKFTSLDFQSLEGLIESIGLDPCQVCTYCWNGKD